MRLSASSAVDRSGFVASLPSLTGMGSTSCYGSAQQFVAWSVSKRSDLERLLPRLVKHMIVKAQHWQWLLEEWRKIRRLGYNERSCSDHERDALTEASKESRRTRVGPLKPKNHPTWAWVSGYLDGDGCYAYRRHYAQTIGYWQWTMNISCVAHKNDLCGLEFLHKAFGGFIVEQGQSDDLFLWKRSLGYQNRDFALRFLPNVAKHSRLKRHKIDQMIHHHRQRLSVPGTKVQATV